MWSQRRFRFELQITKDKMRFDFHQEGFGLLAWRYGQCAIASVIALARDMAIRHREDERFLQSLGKCLAACGSLHANRMINLGNHFDLSATVLFQSYDDVAEAWDLISEQGLR